MKRLRASSDDVIAALLLPRPRRGGHDAVDAEHSPVDTLTTQDTRPVGDPGEDVLFGFPRQRGASAPKPVHRKAAPAPVENPADPCAALRTYIQKHIVELKKLKTELEAEQNGPPKSIAAALDRLEGKPTVDAEKNEKIATTRKEADSVNSLLHAQGCAAINIDKELAKP